MTSWLTRAIAGGSDVGHVSTSNDALSCAAVGPPPSAARALLGGVVVVASSEELEVSAELLASSTANDVRGGMSPSMVGGRG